MIVFVLSSFEPMINIVSLVHIGYKIEAYIYTCSIIIAILSHLWLYPLVYLRDASLSPSITLISCMFQCQPEVYILLILFKLFVIVFPLTYKELTVVTVPIITRSIAVAAEDAVLFHSFRHMEYLES